MTPYAAARIDPHVDAWLGSPRSYPHHVDGDEVRAKETHISKVFLTGPFAYKVKKPVDLGFLDFTTIEERRRDCEREVVLNQRLSRDVYLEVVAITRRDDGLEMGGPGAVVEHAVKMRQLSERDTMERHLESGTLAFDMIHRLAERLAAFHAAADHDDRVSTFGTLESIRRNHRENFEQLGPFVGDVVDAADVYDVRAAAETFMDRWHGLFDARVERGRIRDGHGDLRLDHVYFLDGVQVIDCIEFNERLRCGDVASDLAFLVSELDFRNAHEHGHELARRYARAARDPEIFALLPFYKCYRNVVRAKVECLRLGAGELDRDQAKEARQRARRYLALARQNAHAMARPILWIVCGDPRDGRGRELAREIGRRLAVAEAFHAGGREAGAGLVARAEGALAGGRSVVLEALCKSDDGRDALERAADRQGASVVVVGDRHSQRRESGPSGISEKVQAAGSPTQAPLEDVVLEAFAEAASWREHEA